MTPVAQEHLFDPDLDTRTVPLSPGGVWERVFVVAPLVLVGSKEPTGRYDIAPKHMAMPLGWGDRYCFVCTPRHATYANVEREGAFTVSFPHRFQVVQAGLAASRREPDGSKPSLRALPTFRARKVDGVLVHGCYLFLECELDRLVPFDDEVLVVGRIVAASAREEAVRGPDREDEEVLRRVPPLAYVSPGRFTSVSEARSFPFPVAFSR
ncbi:MAG TPA: flavin reductase [Gaiellaceae bacterium]|jgi:flavin reductase (DIM6/NTAB) family NADH-FMN oxidoreductase RutF|nr:flavin reductase [Gaiellaceae bacterium]